MCIYTERKHDMLDTIGTVALSAGYAAVLNPERRC
jgi:hypothetical protein